MSALEPDRDGVILAAGKRRALFLPSVWRHTFDAREFVRHLMAKAGLEFESLARRPGGEAFPRRILRRAMAADRSERRWITAVDAQPSCD